MVQVTLQPAEVCEVELLPVSDLAESLTARAFGGKCAVHIQASQDGLTWGSPVASARLSSETTLLKLKLPVGTRKIRAVLENHVGKATRVEIDDVVFREIKRDNAARKSA